MKVNFVIHYSALAMLMVSVTVIDQRVTATAQDGVKPYRQK